MPADLRLPQRTRTLVNNVQIGARHPGLQLDKFSPPSEQEQQKTALLDITATGGDPSLLRTMNDRRQRHLGALVARVWRAETAGPLTLHLARASALENAGLCLHPLYGFAYLPGSGLKGMARAYAETVWLPAEADPVAAWQRIEHVFGWTPGTDRDKRYKPADVPKHADDDRSCVGAVVFHDACPETWPRLVVDITNNHHASYYQGDGAPGDWENPVPVTFLAVPAGVTFSFAVAPRTPGREVDRLLDLAADWLKGAMCHAGAGAKTNAGYGVFRLLDEDPPRPIASPACVTWEGTLELVTPAFLAGAGQGAEDCDLRPASLRGLLRWWWRTMHAGFVNMPTLRSLEAAVWGDTKAGGAVRLTIERATSIAPEQYGFKPREDFKRQHGLQDPPDRKTTQGLFYASYGMDETSKGLRQSRWFVPAAGIWRLHLAAWPTWYPSDPKARDARNVAAEAVLEQARAALWLLCRYGGVGSKSRKGFGSLADIDGFTVSTCKHVAAEFRRQCGLPDERDDAETPALGDLHDLDVATPWKDPWFALDQLGFSAQGFAQRYRHKAEKIALGLPRRIHGPRMGPMAHQDAGHHRPPKSLKSKYGDRLASPVHYHLAKAADGGLTIRAVAFPSPHLPDRATSRRVIGELLDHLGKDLRGRIEKHRDKGRTQPTRSVAATSQPAPPQSQHVPKRGDRIEAELLEEKRGKKKDKWQARHAATGWTGYIENSVDVPSDAAAGQLVTLLVHIPINSDFCLRWPTPEVEAAMQKSLAPRPPKKGPRGRR